MSYSTTIHTNILQNATEYKLPLSKEENSNIFKENILLKY